MSAMLAPSDKPPVWPKWLPMEVQIEAERIIGGGIADEALVLRLATDKEMKKVWRELEKHKKDKPSHLSESWAIMTQQMTELKVEPPEVSDPLALFFWIAYTLASLKLAASTFSRFNVPISQYNEVAASLRLYAWKMISLNFQYTENDTLREDRHFKNIEGAADFCDETANILTQVKAAQAPLVVKRNYGNRHARGYVRMLAVEARRLFGRIGYRTIATVASTALAKEISATQVRKWCASLD
jgi:hypothetical protein